MSIIGIPAKITSLPTYKNYVINGNFDVWQRNVTFSSPATGTYLADRWKNNLDGTAGTFVVSRQEFSLGQTDVPNFPKYYLKWNQTAAGSGDGTWGRRLDQRIEDVRTLAGKTATGSVWVRNNGGSNVTMGLFFAQAFGSGGSAEVSGLGWTTFTIPSGGAWTQIRISASIPSISGKTIGSVGANGPSLLFAIAMPSNVIFNVDVAQAQVIEGSVLAPFISRTFAEELELCLPYYEKSYEYDVFAGTASALDGRVFTEEMYLNDTRFANNVKLVKFRKRKRTTPVVKLYSPQTGAVNNVYCTGGGVPLDGDYNTSTINPSETDLGTWTLAISPTTPPLVVWMQFHYTAEAEI